jgi:uncharacterized protein (UPF0332 family)
MRVQDCFDKRLLRRTSPSQEKATRALEISERKLRTAKALLSHGFYDDAIVNCYTCMFQAARGLLFKDGIIEKSHYCVILYLDGYYVRTGKLDQKYLNWLDTYRVERHDALYGLEDSEIVEDEAKLALKRGAEFLDEIKRII